MPLNSIKYFLRLPQLEELRCEFVSEGCRNARYAAIPFDLDRVLQVTNLKTIEITYSFVDAAGIKALLGSCKALEVLKLEYLYELDGWGDLDFSEIGEGLRLHYKTLRKICLDTQYAPAVHQRNCRLDPIEDNIHPAYYWPPIGSLSSFAALDDLAIQQLALLGEDKPLNFRPPSLGDILPIALTKLVLWGCDRTIHPQLENLVAGISK